MSSCRQIARTSPGPISVCRGTAVARAPSALRHWCAWRLRRPFALLVPRDVARDREASRGQDEIERFAAAVCDGGIAVIGRQHQTQRVDDVLARLVSGSTLAHRARHLDDPRDGPAVLVGLVECDRQAKLVAHAPTG
jgi:hypothetical protein